MTERARVNLDVLARHVAVALASKHKIVALSVTEAAALVDELRRRRGEVEAPEPRPDTPLRYVIHVVGAGLSTLAMAYRGQSNQLAATSSGEGAADAVVNVAEAIRIVEARR